VTTQKEVGLLGGTVQFGSIGNAKGFAKVIRATLRVISGAPPAGRFAYVDYRGGTLTEDRVRAYQRLDVPICLGLTNVTWRDVDVLALSRHLAHLTIDGGDVPFAKCREPATSLGQVPALRNLRGMCFRRVDLQAETINRLSDLANLSNLMFIESTIDGSSDVRWHELDHLTDLVICSTPGMHARLPAGVTKCQNLKLLELRCMELSTESLTRICQMQHLKTLRMYGTILPEDAAKSLRDSQIMTVFLDNGQFSAQEIAAIRQGLQGRQVWITPL
jgi:hypothetical protein